MTLSDEPLDRLTPPLLWEPDWSDVLDRAGERLLHGVRSTSVLSKRRLLLALAVLAALLVPLAALSAAKQRWFWWSVHGPTPVNAPVVVKEGEWSGRPWQLVAFRSTTDGLCLALTPNNASSNDENGGVLGCGLIAGVPRTAETKPAADAEILYMSGAATSQLPAFIVGPVIDKASEVEIQFGNEQVLRVPTFEGPASLGRVRFYATEAPASISSPPLAVAGLDGEGHVVACLVRSTAKGGVSPLSDCARSR
jgi:hypothetical protein